MPYVATINTPGYLSTDDDPPMFETAAEAWEYLAEERKRDDLAWTDDGSLDETTLALEAASDPNPMHAGHKSEGTVYGPTPGYDGDHDLGLAYSVTYIPGNADTLTLADREA